MSDKQKQRIDIAEAYNNATSETEFYQLLQQKGYTLYQRYGRYYGIEGKRNIRFSTLGYPLEKIRLLERPIERHKRIEHLIELQKKRKRNRKRKR